MSLPFSIITACYNSQKSIASAIQSVAAQTYPHIQHIIVDGASKDDTIAVVKATGFTGKLISEPDKGIYDALNKGVAHAEGAIIGFVHSDDLLAHPQVIEQVAHIMETTGADIVWGDLVYVKTTDENRVVRSWKSSPYSRQKIRKGWMPPHPTFYCRKEVYQKHGCFNLGYRISADYDFMVRVLKDESLKLAYSPGVMVKMRLGGASNKSLRNILKKMKEDWRVIQHHQLGGIPVLLGKNFSKLSQFRFKK
jgi:glycosyltransferase